MALSSLPAQEKFPKGDTSQESLERTRPAEEETDPEGRQKKQKISASSHPVLPAKTFATSEEQKSTELTMTKFSEVPASDGSEKSPIAELGIVISTINKVVPSLSSEQAKTGLLGSESRIASIKKTLET